jgi:cytoskeleton protein RodZ
MDVGAALRQAREQRRLSIADVAHTTRISVRMLEAIEAGRFDQLPGGLYTRGMLRAFAREVGLDPEQVVALYRNHSETQRERSPASEPAEVQSDRLHVIRSALASGLERLARRIDPTWYVAAAGLLMAWMIWVPGDARAPSSSASAERPAELPSAPKTPDDERAVGTAGAASEPSAVGLAGESLRVELRANAQCWVTAFADGQRALYQLLDAGAVESLSARNELVLRVGNPAGLALTVNGQPGRSLGDGRRPVTVRVTPQTYRDFILP